MRLKCRIHIHIINKYLWNIIGGFVTVSDILATRQGSKYTEDDVKRVVANCSKSRFALRDDPRSGVLQIRANQGHTMTVCHDSNN